jgi:hypothetical protein
MNKGQVVVCKNLHLSTKNFLSFLQADKSVAPFTPDVISLLVKVKPHNLTVRVENQL